jgi:Holliday junction resolvase RusA-like endonuclease
VEDARSPAGASLTITLPLPPSSNKLYQKTRGGGLALTKEAERFREKVKQAVINDIGCLMAIGHKTLEDPEVIYRFDIALYFDSLENPEWFEIWEEDKFYTKDILYSKGAHRGQVQFRKGELKARKGERKAKTRYKVIDTDNRIKFLQDALTKSIGMPNDCQVFGGSQGKYEDPENPRAVVTVTVEPISKYFPERG